MLKSLALTLNSRPYVRERTNYHVKLLTLIVTLFVANGCSVIHDRYGETCNSRAYMQTTLEDFLSTRFQSTAPVRFGVIPFSAPANIAPEGIMRVGAGNQVAWGVQSNLLSTGVVPIVEVFNRQDWPGKKEEFFTGNFGAIDFAREAQYDLVMVGYIEPARSAESVSALTKLIDVDSGVTIWYGRTEATTRRPTFHQAEDLLMIRDRHPSRVYSNVLYDELARCIVGEITKAREVPE